MTSLELPHSGIGGPPINYCLLDTGRQTVKA